MKIRSHHYYALFAFGLLLMEIIAARLLWIRHRQREDLVVLQAQRQAQPLQKATQSQVKQSVVPDKIQTLLPSKPDTLQDILPVAPVESKQSHQEVPEEPKKPNEPWWVVLKMSVETYKTKHPGNQYMSCECAWHYGDCLLQRAHYRMRRLPSADRRYLRQLEKALENWGQADAQWSFEPDEFLSSCGFVFSEAHLNCSRVMDGIVVAYLHPKRQTKASTALQRMVQKYIAALEAAEGPIGHPYRHSREKGEDQNRQANMDMAIEQLRKATLRLRRETKRLHGKAADCVVAYVPDTFGGGVNHD